MARENNLGADPIRQLVFRLAIPSMLAQFVNVLYSIVDRMYIGNIPHIGADALAGAGVCGPIITLISSFAFLIGVGGAPLLAIRLGEDNQDGAEQILANCYMMLLVISAILTSVVLAFKGPLLMWFGASPATFPYANTYLTIYAFGTVFAILTSGLNQFITCQGYSKTAMSAVLIGAVLNILLDPVFIFFLGWGVAGAAVATVLSQAVSAAFVLHFLFGIRPRVRITLGGYSKAVIKRVLSFGFSPFIIIATDSIVIIVLNSVLQRYGGQKEGDMLITCATIVQSYMQLITLPLGGITSGTQPILSFNYGAKQTNRIRRAVRCILLLCLGFTGFMFLLSQFAPHFFVHIFTQDPAYIALSVWGIRVFTLGVVVLAFQYTFVDGLTALGIAKIAVSLSMTRKLQFFAYILLLPRLWGAQSAFFAEPACDIIGGIISTTVFLLIFGKLMKKRDQMPDGQSLYA